MARPFNEFRYGWLCAIFAVLCLHASSFGVANGQTVCTEVMDLAFVVDGSGSICDSDPNFNFSRDSTCQNWNFILQFIGRVCDTLTIGPNATRVAMVMFSSSARLVWGLGTYTDKASLMNAISTNLTYQKGGTTDTTGGLNVVNTQVFNMASDRPGAPNTAIIITDGKPTDSSTVQAAIDAVHANNIRTLVVGVTSQVDDQTLKRLSSPPQQPGVTYFMATDFSTIDNVRLQLANQTCSQEPLPQSTTATTSTTPTPATIRISSAQPSTVCNAIWDLCFVVDASGSICDTDPNFNFTRDETCSNWNSVLQFIHRLVDGLNVGLSEIRVGMVLFDTTTRVLWNLTSYTTKDSLLNAIDRIAYRKGGQTDTTGGLNLMRTDVFSVNGDRANVSNVAIIITDGKPTNTSTVQAAIDSVHNSGITTLVVGVTDQVDEATLKQLSSPPQQLGKTYFMATGFQSIEDVRLQLENQTCAAVQPPSSTALPIVVTSMSMPTSPATRPPIECEALWDLCFVVDASGSICDADPNFNFSRDSTCGNWNFTLQFIHRIADGLNIGLSQYRVGMVIFDTTSHVEFNLTTYTTKDSLLNAIDRIAYRKGGQTDTTGGLNLMRTDVFSVNGDRANVSNVAIIITDGKPTNTSTVQAAIDSVHNSGITTLVVGVTDQVDEATLKQLSSPPQQLGKTYFIVSDFQSIDVVRLQLENQTCAAVQPSGSTPSAIVVTSVTLPTSPSADQPIVCKSLLDICFVLDASGSICDTDSNFNYITDDTCNNWSLILQFMHGIADSLNIGSSEVRLGMVIFDSIARVAWNLTAYTSKDSLLNAIDRIAYRKGGRTDTTGGLNLMRTQVFGVNGDRANVTNVAIIITDGKPTNASTIQAAIDAVHNSGITTLVVGVTNEVDEATLKQLSSPPQQLNVTYFMATGFDTLGAMRVILQEQTCGVTP